VNQTYEAWVHRTTAAGPGAVRRHLSNQLGFVGHYRVKAESVNYNETWSMKHKFASTEDPALLSDVPLIEERLRKRFGQDPKVLLKSLLGRRPTPTNEVGELLMTSNATTRA